MKSLMVLIIGIAMIYGLFHIINQERSKEGKKSLGLIPTIIIIVIVLIIWGLLSKI